MKVLHLATNSMFNYRGIIYQLVESDDGGYNLTGRDSTKRKLPQNFYTAQPVTPEHVESIIEKYIY